MQNDEGTHETSTYHDEKMKAPDSGTNTPKKIVKPLTIHMRRSVDIPNAGIINQCVSSQVEAGQKGQAKEYAPCPQ